MFERGKRRKKGFTLLDALLERKQPAESKPDIFTVLPVPGDSIIYKIFIPPILLFMPSLPHFN